MVIVRLQLAERIISAVEESTKSKPPMSLLVSFSAEDVRKQAAASTQRFLDGIDDYLCTPCTMNQL